MTTTTRRSNETKARSTARVLATLGSALALLATATGAGCSSSDGPPDTAHFASAMAASFCDALAGCCGKIKAQYDSASCLAQMQAQFQTTVDVVKHGKVVYNAGQVSACQQAYQHREAQCDAYDAGPSTTDAGGVDPITSACWGIFKGTVQPGESCDFDLECATPSADVTASCQQDPKASGPNKVCVQIERHVAIGGDCSTGSSNDDPYHRKVCESTQGFCALTGGGSTGVCKAYAAIGDSCGTSSNAACDPHAAFCNYSSGQCAGLPKVGESCDDSSGQCVSGAWCEPSGSSNTCQQRKQAGESCTRSAECLSGNCDNGSISSDGGTNGVCTASGVYDISPRTCGYGPFGNGPEDEGIKPPAKGIARADWYAMPTSR